MAKPHASVPQKGINAEPEATRRRAALARLHVAKKERGLDDDIWRDVIERVTGKRSLKDLDVRELHRLLDEVAGKRGDGSCQSHAPHGPRAAGGSGVVGPYAGKLRAMWLSGWHLGVIRDSSDAALVAFVKRQTGLDAVRFLREAKAAAAAIEALKSWLARAGGVEWSDHPDNPRRAVVEAQWRRLAAMQAVGFYVPGDREADALERYAARVSGGRAAFHFMSEENWDAVIRALGAKLRHELAKTGPTEL